MIRINEVNLPLDYDNDFLYNIAVKKLNVSRKDIKGVSLFRRAIDARKKQNIHFTAAIDVLLKSNENRVAAKCKDNKINIVQQYRYILPEYKKLDQRPIVVGFGPAGMFSALILAMSGQNPIVIERGSCIEQRCKDVSDFWNNRNLNIKSNVQFGEGGAGTFSDGKLNTGTKDIRGRMVLEEFVANGAPEEILYNAKPHIGTDMLRNTVINLRNKIISLGGEIKFDTQLTDIISKDNRVVAVKVQNHNTTEIIETNNIILAIGHSARDTFEMIYNKNIAIEPKPFSVGARIEHPQELINKSQYGSFYNNKYLKSADYKLAEHLKNGRGVYTFCMCPGGVVVSASSEKNMVVTNGMSEFARNNCNANSALLVSVAPEDFGSSHILAGMQFQRSLEKNAFEIAGNNYNAPVQRVEDFLNNKASSKVGDVIPSYKPDVTPCNLSECLPDFVTESMREGIKLFNNKIKGFSYGDAVLTGVETRSSSPIRIIRNDNLQSISLNGLYPCGEGAGYAGGIVSAGVDGIKCAEKLISK